jgi:hypothetical protein
MRNVSKCAKYWLENLKESPPDRPKRKWEVTIMTGLKETGHGVE